MMADSALLLVVSMGDPAGVGLEIAVKAYAGRANGALPPFGLIGDTEAVARAVKRAGLSVPIALAAGPGDIEAMFPTSLPVLPLSLAREETPGQPDPENAPAIIAAIEQGVGHCLAGRAGALVTLPIAKAPLYAAGFRFPGHTEFIAALTAEAPGPRQRGPIMMLAGPSLKVALVSIHLPLAEAIRTLTAKKIIAAARVTAEALRRDFGVDRPRLALAGLNPHAGEGGALGREEIEIINPAAAALRAEGIDITDAKPPDALFHAEARAGYDAAIALYHDQGLIPLKTLHFWDGVNVTLGLPIVRASPDHGTAFDIAGKNVANAESFVAALRLAAEMARQRAKASHHG